MPENLKQSFVDFHKSMISSGVIDPKTTFMIQIGAAMSIGCYPCMEILISMAKEKGISNEEVGAIQAIAMAVAAGSIFNQVKEIYAKI